MCYAQFGRKVVDVICGYINLIPQLPLSAMESLTRNTELRLVEVRMEKRDTSTEGE